MNNNLKTVQELGEQGILSQVQKFSPRKIVGDDGAWLKTEPDKLLVVTTDLLVEGVHFSERTTPAEAVGWRAAAANLSDLAAMGATPLGITVGLSIRGDLTIDWVENLYQGMTDCLQPYHCPILGGDITRSSVVTIAITAFGQVAPNQLIRRSSAIAGDAIVITGEHGLSRAGLELLLNPTLGEKIAEKTSAKLIQAHQTPQPRLDVLPYLQEISPTAPIAGMDSSDGLADAVIQICRASRVGAQIDSDCLPIPPELLQLTTPEQALEWVLYGGEDFELVLCLPVSQAEVLVRKLGSSAAIIGKVISHTQVILRDPTGCQPDKPLSLHRGFQHFDDKSV